MKKVLSSIPATLCLLTLLLASNVHAQEILPTPDFTEFKMVGSNNPLLPGSRITKNTFGLEENPFLYIKISATTTGSLRSFWTGPDEKERTRSRNITPSSGTEFWLSLLHWAKDKQPGHWSVEGQIWSGGSLANKTETSFIVTPEPVACLLYGIGGLPIFSLFLRRKRV